MLRVFLIIRHWGAHSWSALYARGTATVFHPKKNSVKLSLPYDNIRCRRFGFLVFHHTVHNEMSRVESVSLSDDVMMYVGRQEFFPKTYPREPIFFRARYLRSNVSQSGKNPFWQRKKKTRYFFRFFKTSARVWPTLSKSPCTLTDDIAHYYCRVDALVA